MKNLIAFLCLAFAAALFPGCGTLDPSGPYNGDQTLYAADLAITNSYQLFDTFAKWEYDNRAALSSRPEVKAAADKVRAEAKGWIQTAIAFREAYAANPTAGNRVELTQAIGVIQAALTEIAKHMTAPAAPNTR